MTEERERYVTTDAQLTTLCVPIQTDEIVMLRAELRRLRILWLWERGDVTNWQAVNLLALTGYDPQQTPTAALRYALAEARKALGLEER